jgi:26 proteasome complex subunit DSS1
MSSSQEKAPAKASTEEASAAKQRSGETSNKGGPDAEMSGTKEAIEAIEEDDEFEEFQEANWGAGEEDAEDTQQWQDNWDADDMDDDFTKNLREELMRADGGSGST